MRITFNIGGWHPELDCDNEVFLGIVLVPVFDLIGWKTKRHGKILEGKAPVFVTRREMIDDARNKGAPWRGVLLKTLLKAERTRRQECT